MADTTSIYGALKAFGESYPGLIVAIRGFCYMSAFIIVIYNITQVAAVAEGRTSNGKNPQAVMKSFFIGLILATVLVNIPVMLDSITRTLGMTGNNPFDYASNLQEGAGPLLKPVINFINFIGLLAFIRGFFVIREWADNGSTQRATLNKGLVLVFVGTIALNVISFVTVLAKTFNMPALANWVAQ